MIVLEKKPLAMGIFVAALAVFSTAQIPSALAQSPTAVAKSLRGFNLKAEALADGEERTSQAGLWVLEVNYKSLRMIHVNLADPRTGQTKRELIWYFVYKAVNRSLQNQQAAADTNPMNEFDVPPGDALFIPQITLITNDNGGQKIYEDQIIPKAQAAIIRRERLPLKNSVQITGKIPTISTIEDGDKNAIYGVAMWRGIDPRTDYFTVVLSGFSNGYRYVNGPVPYSELQNLVAAGELKANDRLWTGKGAWVAAQSMGDLFDETKQPPEDTENTTYFYTVTPERFSEEGAPPVWRKTLIQSYWRPGDRFRQFESEIRAKGDPQWVYRASEQPNKKFLTVVAAAPTNPAQPMPNQPMPNNGASKPQGKNAISNFFKNLDRALKGGK